MNYLLKHLAEDGPVLAVVTSIAMLVALTTLLCLPWMIDWYLAAEAVPVCPTPAC